MAIHNSVGLLIHIFYLEVKVKGCHRHEVEVSTSLLQVPSIDYGLEESQSSFTPDLFFVSRVLHLELEK